MLNRQPSTQIRATSQSIIVIEMPAGGATKGKGERKGRGDYVGQSAMALTKVHFHCFWFPFQVMRPATQIYS